MYQRLALLRSDEPPVHVLDGVLDRLDHAVPRRPATKLVRPALVALSIVVGALLVASVARWRVVARAARWRVG